MITQGPTYLFCLQDKNYNFYQVKTDGTVTISAKPYFLNFSPSGWDDIAIQNLRNKRYWGIDRSVTIPLSYVEDGAKIIKDIFYRKGISETVYLVIASQELVYTPSVEYGFWYKQIYRGEIDFSTFSHVSVKVTLSTLEDGLPKYLKSNENTVEEIPNPDVIVKADGINLREKLNFQQIDDFDINAGTDNGKMIPCIFTGNDGDSVGVLFQTQNFSDISISSTAAQEGITNFFVRNVSTNTISMTVSGVLELICTQRTASQANSRIMLVTQKNGVQITNNDIAPLFSHIVGQIRTFPFSITVPLAPDETMFIFDNFNIIGTSCTYKFTANSKFSVNFITRQPTTYVAAWRPQTVYNYLIQKLTASTYTAAIAAYFIEHANKVFTCGNALRGIENLVLKISWSDFFNFWDCFDSVSISTQGKVINFLKKESSVDTSNVIVLDSPALDTFKVGIAKDYLFNELEIGYPDLDNEVGVLNGKQEFNTKFAFSTGASASPAKIDKVSKVKASCYEVEKIRITTFEKNTTDYKADNDVFVLHIEDVLQPASGNIPAHYNLNRTLNASVTAGLIAPESVFNLIFSPKRNLLRNASFLRSSFYKGDAQTLFFKSATRNADLVCDEVIEKADVNIGSMPTAFFVPILLEGDFPAPDDILQLLDTNPLQVFSFPINGDDYFGVMMKTSIAPSNRKVQNYQFLSLATNNLENLIEFYG